MNNSSGSKSVQVGEGGSSWRKIKFEKAKIFFRNKLKLRKSQN
jgi:hypothetical protein